MSILDQAHEEATHQYKELETRKIYSDLASYLPLLKALIERLIKTNYLEDNLGLKKVLNIIDKEGIKSPLVVDLCMIFNEVPLFKMEFNKNISGKEVGKELSYLSSKLLRKIQEVGNE